MNLKISGWMNKLQRKKKTKKKFFVSDISIIYIGSVCVNSVQSLNIWLDVFFNFSNDTFLFLLVEYPLAFILL